MKNKIYITLGSYFPATILFFASLMAFAGMILLFENTSISIILIFLSLVVFTAHYRLDIDMQKQSYHDYLWIAGFKKGEKNSFHHVDCLFVNQNAYRQTVNSRISTMTKRGTEYHGYLRLDDTDIHLISSDKKFRVMKKLNRLSKKLQVKVLDYTTSASEKAE